MSACGRMLTSVGLLTAKAAVSKAGRLAEQPPHPRVRGWIRPLSRIKDTPPLYYRPAKDVEASRYRVDLTIKMMS